MASTMLASPQSARGEWQTLAPSVRGKRGAVGATQLIASLSLSERQVLNALAAGRSNKLIAFDLGISVRTVEVHRAQMMKRLGVRQFAEAIRIAVLAAVWA
jgi:FixJ family two-component response regulator